MKSAEKLMSLETVMLSKVIQIQKDKHHMFTLLWILTFNV